MKARLILGAKEEGGPAFVDIDGVTYECMDCLGYSSFGIKEGDHFFARFSWISYEDHQESWEEIFSGNPDQELKMVPLGGWAYRGYGEVISIDPPLVNCGIVLPSPIDTHDAAVLGAYLAFNMSRLDVYAV
jgi:hypothetical protein